MRIRGAVLAYLAIAMLSSGCLARQVASDGCDFRQALLDMYTDQLMDNLIRAAQNRAFVQLVYRGLVVTDSQILKGNLGGEVDPTQTHTVLQSTRAVLNRMHGATSKLLVGSSLERDRQMQVFADPVIAKQDVYDFYMAFAHGEDAYHRDFACRGVPAAAGDDIRRDHKGVYLMNRCTKSRQL
jgi:hypothetical protein